MPKKSHPYYHDLTTIIRAKLAEASKLHVLNVIEDKESSADEIARSFKRGNQSHTTLMDFFEIYESELYSAKRIGYSKIFRYVKNSLAGLTNGRDYRFKSLFIIFLTIYGIIKHSVVDEKLMPKVNPLKT